MIESVMVLSPACLASTAADDDGDDGDTSRIVSVQFSSNYQNEVIGGAALDLHGRSRAVFSRYTDRELRLKFQDGGPRIQKPRTNGKTINSPFGLRLCLRPTNRSLSKMPPNAISSEFREASERAGNQRAGRPYCGRFWIG